MHVVYCVHNIYVMQYIIEAILVLLICTPLFPVHSHHVLLIMLCGPFIDYRPCEESYNCVINYKNQSNTSISMQVIQNSIMTFRFFSERSVGLLSLTCSVKPPCQVTFIQSRVSFRG